MVKYAPIHKICTLHWKLSPSQQQSTKKPELRICQCIKSRKDNENDKGFDNLRVEICL